MTERSYVFRTQATSIRHRIVPDWIVALSNNHRPRARTFCDDRDGIGTFWNDRYRTRARSYRADRYPAQGPEPGTGACPCPVPRDRHGDPDHGPRHTTPTSCPCPCSPVRVPVPARAQSLPLSPCPVPGPGPCPSPPCPVPVPSPLPPSPSLLPGTRSPRVTVPRDISCNALR